ncbi:MAG: hypothetical protein ABIE68_01775 [bacterium]
MKRLVLLTILLLFFIATPASAQAISIMAPEYNYQVKPGETITETVRLFDNTLNGKTVYPAVYNFTQSEDSQGTIRVITDPTELLDDINWVKISQNAIQVPSDGSIVEVKMTITIPQDARPGAHLVTVAYSDSPPAEDVVPGTTNINLVSQLLCNLFITVVGPASETMEADFKVGRVGGEDVDMMSPEQRQKNFKEKKFFLKPPVDFLLTGTNTGDTLITPSGNISIYNDLFGGKQTGEQLLINDSANRILPDTGRAIETPRFGDGIMIGKYRAKMTLVYGTPAQGIEITKSFWIVPVVEIAIVLGSLLILTLLITLYIHWRKKKREELEEEQESKIAKKVEERLSKKESPTENSSENNDSPDRPKIV